MRIVATHLEAACERLDVIVREKTFVNSAWTGSPDASWRGRFRVESVEAKGDVTLEQGDRLGSARRMLVLPQESRVVLEGEAVVTDPKGRISGHRLILNRGQRRAVIEGGEGRRARITLPELKSETP